MPGKIEDQMAAVTKKILTLEGLEGKVTVAKKEDQISIEIDSEPAGLLIGRQGQNLQALERVLQVLLYSLSGKQGIITCDVGGFRKKRDEFIQGLADRTIEEVLRSGEAKTLSGLTATERKAIHLKVAQNPQLTSESQGTGVNRVLVIKPKG